MTNSKLVLEKNAETEKFVNKIEELSGQNVYACYQCGKCSAGCPLVDQMDLLPNQVIRLLQLGDDSVLDSNTYWLCAACFVCSTRCPKGVKITEIMEALRVYQLRRNKEGKTILEEIPKEEIEKLPVIALVSNLRKLEVR
ncbi:MAG: 4Fe-4S dicluster domain-containing protein [Candidatus Hodarchaeota archaeon]